MSLLRAELCAAFDFKVSNISGRQLLKEWFKEALEVILLRCPIWYQSAIDEIILLFKDQFMVHAKVKKYNFSQLNLFDFINNFYLNNSLKINSALIPPKRTADTRQVIDFREKLKENGKGLFNALFYLKNQDLGTKPFQNYYEIKRKFRSITDHDFNVILTDHNCLKLIFCHNKESIDADHCGLGLRDLLFLITFTSTSSHTTYLIEEPESHLHADFQKKLLPFFHELPNKQFIISTHSNVFLDSNCIDKVYYCWYENTVSVSDQTSLSKILDTLGYSVGENLTSDAIILTEGHTDIPIIKKVLTLAGVMDNFNVKFMPLGGDSMLYIDLTMFSNKRNVFAVIDKDPKSSSIRNQFKKNCAESNIRCFQTEGYSIENYIPFNLIKEALSGQIPSKVSKINLTESVDVQLGLTNSNSIKRKIMHIAPKLELEHINKTGLWTFALSLKNALEQLNSNVSERPSHSVLLTEETES